MGRKTPKTATGPPREGHPRRSHLLTRRVVRITLTPPPIRVPYPTGRRKLMRGTSPTRESGATQATPGRLTPGRGRAATDTERQVKKAEADKSSEEKAVVARGRERDASKARRDEQREAAQQDTSDLVDLEREDLAGLSVAGRSVPSPPRSPWRAWRAEVLDSLSSSATQKSAKNERRVDDLLATMRKRLAARERAEGGTETIRRRIRDANSVFRSWSLHSPNLT